MRFKTRTGETGTTLSTIKLIFSSLALPRKLAFAFPAFPAFPAFSSSPFSCWHCPCFITAVIVTVNNTVEAKHVDFF
ncbi:hypothetical protein [Photobacterium kishitanii]|uniref:hypothetical protein n=1 Tax=Photobacterium kishitanii TaxID=318456 RepID=UPI0012D41CFC|nr:hypothetical protein [Photobacterium kishitanii]